MQIISAKQMREWDHFTIAHEPITSIDLMERAAQKCADWIYHQSWQHRPFKIFCGKGNNGGDGLAIGRLLLQKGYSVSIYILEFGKIGTADFQQNLHRLHDLAFTDIHFIQSTENFPSLQPDDVIIDALFGSGINKPIQDFSAALVNHLNQANSTIISIDVPSGLFLDESSVGNTIIHATHTLTFETYKLGLLVQENGDFMGNVHVLQIGLHPNFLEKVNSAYQLIDKTVIKEIYKPRKKFSHKGAFGHSLVVAGSYGKMGAATLAAKACVRSGAGLTTAFIPRCGYSIMQTAVPEAMVLCGENENEISSLPDDMEKYSSIAIGPGLGTGSDAQNTISFIIRRYTRPLVLDADGLNCLSLNPELLPHLPPHSIITPHPKEFERLFGPTENDFDRMAMASKKAIELQIIIVLKGHHTFISLPDGKIFFNSTGNSGMAKGGSGDVLTGIISALLSQGYLPQQAALLSVYLHGLSADMAVEIIAKEALTASDIINFLPQAFLHL